MDVLRLVVFEYKDVWIMAAIGGVMFGLCTRALIWFMDRRY